MTLKELRKAIKPMGYKIKTKMVSWGRHLTYVHIENGKELTGNVFNSETIKPWQPLFDYLATIPCNTLLEDTESRRVYGSQFTGERQ